MQRKLVCIGGGENGRLLENGNYAPYETLEIDKEIVRLTKKQKPNFLFINHAMESLTIQESYYQTMKKTYEEKFNCNCKDLKSNELENEKIVKEKVAWADIIYEGGGDTSLLLDLWQKTKFDKVLYDAWLNGKVICGISAGAVCYFKSCNSDSSKDSKNKFSSLKGLNWFNFHITPHCNEDLRYESTIEQLKENNLVGIMLSNCAALEIIDDKYRIITSKNKDIPYALKGYFIKNEYKEQKLNTSNRFKSINELLNKK